MFCTFPRMRTLKILCAALPIAMTAPLSSAQNTERKANPAQLEMHIRVKVVPVAMPPRHDKHKDQDEESIIYNLSTHRETMSVTEEVRPMLVQEGGSIGRLEQVRITTVVAK